MTIEELTTFEKLNNAFYESARISQWKESTQRYKSNLFANNLKLQQELRNGTYKISQTTNFTLTERGKERNIEAPAIRDRIIQKVLCQNILVPYLTKPLIYDNYASLKGRGTSFARKRVDVLLQKFIRKHDDGYVLQINIKKYFESIDHDILKIMLHERICEPKDIMDLIDYFVDTSSHSNKGLNLGSEAPQIFAIYYLSPIDSYIKTVKSIKYYGRYMDDMFIFSDDKQALKELLKEIKTELAKLKLQINDKKTHITKLGHGFTLLQIKYNVDGNKIIKRPTHSKIVRERKRLKKYKKLYDCGAMAENDIRNCYMSWRNALIKDCNACYKTIQSMDALYKELFPVRESTKKLKRSEIIERAFKELYEPEFGEINSS